MDYFIALIPLLALSVNVFFQVATFRYRLIPSLLKSIYFGFLIGLLFAVLVPEQTFHQILMSAFSYSFLGYGYFHFINLGETGRRIRILREFLLSDGLSEEEILTRYNAKKMLEMRLGRLIRTKQIEIQNNRLIIARRNVLWMSKIMSFVKTLILGKAIS